MISILKKVVLNDILQNKVLSSTLLLLPHLSVSAYLLLDVISWFKSTTIFLKEIVALPMFYLHFWIIFLCIFLILNHNSQNDDLFQVKIPKVTKWSIFFKDSFQTWIWIPFWNSFNVLSDISTFHLALIKNVKSWVISAQKICDD